MGNFRILLLLPLLGLPSAFAAAPTTQPVTVASRVTLNLLPVLSAEEVTPIPRDSVCAALASGMGPDGQPLIPGGARLLNAGMPEDELADAVVEGLSQSFGGSGLKLGRDLVLLTGPLKWVPQGNAQVMVATFERGTFRGFFDSRTQHVRERLLLGVSGSQVCVVPG